MFTCRAIISAIQTDFNERNVGAEVVYGNWKLVEHAGANKVYIAMLTGSLDYTGPNAAGWGGMRPLPNPAGGDPVEAAATMVMQMQKMKVWCHGVAGDDVPLAERIAGNVDRANELLHAAVAALKRHLTFTSLTLGALEWPSIDSADVTYGACVAFECAIAIPILSDRMPIVPMPYKAVITPKTKFPGGTAEMPPFEVPEG